MRLITALLLALTFVSTPRCDSDNRQQCARYALKSLIKALPSDFDRLQAQYLLAIVYSRELALFANSDVSWEALVRSYYDKQSGASVSLSAWLASMQAVIDSVDSDGNVNLKRLLCCYEKYMDNATWALGHDEWKDGQGVDVPSVWGSAVIETGATSFTHDGMFDYLITHIYDSGYSFGDDVREGVKCSYVTAIVSTEGRFQVSTCTQ